mgnify:CR=1 FL=1
MTSTTITTELQNQYVELKVCRDQCEVQLSRMVADGPISHGLLAMEIAAIVRHETKLHQLEKDLRLMKVPVPRVDVVQSPIAGPQ